MDLLIIAAGNSTRMGGEPKVFSVINGKPNIEHILVNTSGCFNKTYLVLNKSDVVTEALNKYKELLNLHDVEVLRIDSGFGDADAINKSIKQLTFNDDFCTVVWGDTYFQSNDIFNEVSKINLTNDSLCYIPVKNEDDPYAWFDLGENNTIINHCFKSESKHIKGKKPHDQSVFVINHKLFCEVFNNYTDSIIQNKKKEIKLLPLITFAAKNYNNKKSFALFLDTLASFSYNNKNDLAKINSMESEKKEKMIVCIFSYHHDENTIRNYEIFSKKFVTYIIDNYHLDNGGKFRIENDNIFYLHNVGWGGQIIEAYKLVQKHDAEYLLTIDGDIEIDDNNVDKMLESLDFIDYYDNIGVYTATLKLGSKSRGSTQVLLSNCELYNLGTGQLRNVFRNEGWFNVFKRDILDDIIPKLRYPENHYGWGICPALCRRAINRGYRIVADDRYCVFHPAKIEYDNIAASREEKTVRAKYPEWDCLLPEEIAGNYNFDKWYI